MTKQACRRRRRIRWLEIPAQDFGHAVRALRKSPSFTLVAALTLALGIGVNVAVFSLFQQILLRPLPALEPDRLVNLTDPGPKPNGLTYGSMAGGSDSVFSYPMFRDLERAQEPFVGLAAHRIFDANISTGEEAQRDTGMFVSGSYFSVLGLQPVLGRLLGPQDDRIDGQAESVVLSHAYWQSRFGGDPDIVGSRLIVNGQRLTIAGVAPRGFHGTTVGTRASIFVPITFASVDAPTALPNHDNRGYYWVYLFARLAPGVGRDAAELAVNRSFRAILNETEAPLLSDVDSQELEAFRAKLLVLEPGAHGQSSTLATVRERLEILFAVSGIVLMLCCANVAGLLLVRGSARSGEIAVRTSMGASRGRIASLLLAEALLLALPAALASLPVAVLTLLGLASGIPGLPAAAFDVDLELDAAFVAIGVAVVSALAFALLPLRDLIRAQPRSTLQAFGTRQTSAKGVTRFRAGLATTQIALSMALLAMAGIFAQSLANIARIDLGMDVESLVTFSISPEASGYSPGESARLFDRLEQELAAIPGVTSAASAMVPLLSGSALTINEQTALNYISHGFFRTLGIELLSGRDFTDADTADAPPVAIVNQRFAERRGLGQDVIGERIDFFGTDTEIVGLVANAKYHEVTRDIGPQMFLPRHQNTTLGSMSFYIRSMRPPEALLSAAREAAARVDPIVPITDLRTMEQQVRENTATERFVAGTSAAFAVLATILAALGLYGVLAYSVVERSREIGLRAALGAAPGRIRGMVLWQATMIALAGIALGVAATSLLGRAAQSLLFGLEAVDPIALAAAAAILVGVTLTAAYLPARHASNVDPMSVLRYE